MKKFEYKSLAIEITTEGNWVKKKSIEASKMISQLNELGQEGWELVNSIDHAIDGYTLEVVLLLKREISSLIDGHETS